jgi:hypothetical protein
MAVGDLVGALEVLDLDAGVAEGQHHAAAELLGEREGGRLELADSPGRRDLEGIAAPDRVIRRFVHTQIVARCTACKDSGRLPDAVESPDRRPSGHTMTSRGNAQARFQRAIRRRHVLAAEMAARELGGLSLSEALSLCLLYEAGGDPRFERAFRKWLGRVRRDEALTHEQVELLRAAAGALGSPFRVLGLAALLGACRELHLPQPTLPE